MNNALRLFSQRLELAWNFEDRVLKVAVPDLKQRNHFLTNFFNLNIAGEYSIIGMLNSRNYLFHLNIQFTEPLTHVFVFLKRHQIYTR